MHEIACAEIDISEMPQAGTPAASRLCGAIVRIGDERYRIECLKAAGGTAEIFRAAVLSSTSKQTPARRTMPDTVAVKVMRPEYAASPIARERFLREAELLCRLSHPNLVRGLALGQAEGCPLIVMEYIAGQTLAARIKEGPLEASEALRIASEVLSALNHLYLDGRVSAHRDIKPSNIMLAAGGTAKLIDLGVARTPLYIERPLDTGLLGTPLYLAPEQIDDAASADIRSDIFSLGAVLFEMLCGTRAFSGQGTRQILAQRLSNEPPSLRDTGMFSQAPALEANLDAMLRKAMAADRLERYQTPSEFLAAIEDASQLLDRDLDIGKDGMREAHRMPRRRFGSSNARDASGESKAGSTAGFAKPARRTIAAAAAIIAIAALCIALSMAQLGGIAYSSATASHGAPPVGSPIEPTGKASSTR